MPMNELVQSDKLASLETVIDAGLEAFWQVGEAFRTIRDEELYRPSHPTFNAYCLDRWGFTASRSRQLSAGAEIRAQLQDEGVVELPSNEGQTRALGQVPEDARADVWALAVETAFKLNRPTTASIIKAVASVLNETGNTGAISIEGTQLSLQALVKGAISEDAIEALMRQRDHIAQHSKPLQKWRGVVVGVSVQDGKQVISIMIDEGDLDEALVGKVAGVWVK